MMASFGVALLGACLVMGIGFENAFLMPAFVLIMRIGLQSV